jgi:arylsulfatase A-like enzyme
MNLRPFLLFLSLILCTSAANLSSAFAAKPQPGQASRLLNIVLVMADDMGYGQTGYYNHPVLKTPNLDAMADNGLRLDRFYAGAPNCSPTRATVMTGRSNDRTGVIDHGYPLHLQEHTVGRALRDAGYATGHFGKWHLNGLRGPGAPILASDERTPGAFGLDTWLSVTNFFDRDPIMSRTGDFEEFEGDSSEISIAEALKFIGKQAKAGTPSFTVIWFGTPHSPFMATEDDMAPFADLNDASRLHYGELVAMDRSIGTLRQGLRDLDIAENTLLWFNSDNGGLPKITPETVGGLRGFKGTVYEGGLRVPAIIEWPAVIKPPRISEFPAGTVDIFPTLAAAAGLPESVLLQPQDGISLLPLFKKNLDQRKKPLPFRHGGRGAFVDNDYKLVTLDIKKDQYELYNLADDPNETTDIAAANPEVLARLKAAFEAWNETVEASAAGKDYPEGRVTDKNTERRSWPETPEYAPYLEIWKDRPEFKRYIK